MRRTGVRPKHVHRTFHAQWHKMPQILFWPECERGKYIVKFCPSSQGDSAPSPRSSGPGRKKGREGGAGEQVQRPTCITLSVFGLDQGTEVVAGVCTPRLTVPTTVTVYLEDWRAPTAVAADLASKLALYAFRPCRSASSPRNPRRPAANQRSRAPPLAAAQTATATATATSLASPHPRSTYTRTSTCPPVRMEGAA